MKKRSCPAILLSVVLLLSLGACQEKPQPTPTSSPTQATATPVPTAAPTPVRTPEPTPEPTEEPFTFTRQNFPRLNGSTSTVPLAEAVCSALLGESREDVGDLVQFSKTTRAYMELLSGNADLLIIGEANADILAEKETKGFEWLKTPFATDAFVFVVNENNPVDSITVEEARKIYTGEITNWAELGGNDTPIIPFQRNAEAGSQTLMEKHVMQGTPMMEAPEDYIVASMGGLMAAVKSYDNSAGAIGYSVYYYAEEMKAAQGLKLLKLEGVEPNPNTIRSEEYPIVNPKYVVISAEAVEDSPTRRLYDWLLSEEGQALIAAEGYVSVMEFETLPRDTEIETIGRPWEGEWNGLAPLTEPRWVTAYAGQRLSDEWPSYTGCLYGLMTEEGEAVTPPVYSEISTPVWRNWYSTDYCEMDLLVLRQGEAAEEGSWGAKNVCTLAARDMSWVYPGTWRQVIPGPGYLLLLGEDHMEKVSVEGRKLQTWDYASYGLAEYMNELLNAEFFESIQGHVVGNLLGVGFVRELNGSGFYLFDLNSGEVVTRTGEELREEFEPEDYVGYEWTVEETETGSRFTRGEETVELPMPAASDYAYLWGDLVIFLNSERIFHRTGREILPTDKGKPRGIGSLGHMMGQMEEGDLLCLRLYRYKTEDTLTTFFIRADGSVLNLTKDSSIYDYNIGFTSADGNILGIVERDRAAYYRIDTEECVFRIPLYYESD